VSASVLRDLCECNERNLVAPLVVPGICAFLVFSQERVPVGPRDSERAEFYFMC
jgi:hypothetical protein